MDITRGNLDEISRPASNHRNQHRTGSRVSLGTPSSAGSTRQGIDTGNSLEILPPESPVLNQQEFDLEVVELFSSDTDSECDVDNQSDDNKEDGESRQQPNNNSHNNNGVENGQKSSNNSANRSPATPDPLDAIPDPKIREAMRKMMQLDRILAKKVVKEKEVKRQRLKAHRDMERELQGLKPEGREEQREVSDNTSRFLALVPPASHSEGVLMNEDPVEPVFPTQPAETDSPVAGDKVSGTQRTKPNSHSERGDGTDRSSQPEVNTEAQRGGKRRAKGKGHDDVPQGESNFIQRNIDLASDAGNVIAMTDDEKKRLEELLQDVEMLVDEEEKLDSNRVLNALQLSAGIGYIPDAAEQQALQDIDTKLKALLPAEDFDRISTTPSQARGSYYHIDIDPGEKILKDTKEDRTQRERLKRIEDELEYLETRVEREIYKSPRLSQENLADLLEQCSELSSRAATETDSILQASPRSDHTLSMVDEDDYDTQEETPRLPDDVLQKLLAEARESCLSESRLTPISSLDSQQLTSRSDGSNPPSFSLVSQSTIKELLRNPRATSNIASTTGMIMDIAERNHDRLEEGDLRALLDIESGQALGGTRIVNGHSDSLDSKKGLGSAEIHQLTSQYDVTAGQTLSEQMWHDPSSPRCSQQSPQPHTSNRLPDQGEVSTGKTSLSIRSFSSSTNFHAASLSLKSPEPPPSKKEGSTIRNAGAAPNRPRMSAGSPEPSALRFKPTLSEASESFEPSPQPPSSKQTTTWSGRSKKAKAHTRSSIESRGTSSSPAGHTDSRASTNTLVSSSDFEYEEDEEITQQLLPHSPSARVKGQRSWEDRSRFGSNTASRSMEQSVVRSIARFEKKGTEKERFSPPLV